MLDGEAAGEVGLREPVVGVVGEGRPARDARQVPVGVVAVGLAPA